MAGRRVKLKRKAKKQELSKDFSSLLGVSDFSEFGGVDYQSSSREDSPEDLDSDTEDAIYAQIYFNPSSDVACWDSLNKGLSPPKSSVAKGTEEDTVNAGGLDVQLRVQSPDSSVGSGDLEALLRGRESGSVSSESPGQQTLEFSFVESSADENVARKNRRTERGTTSGDDGSGLVIVALPDQGELGPSKQSEAEAPGRLSGAGTDRLAVAGEDTPSSSTPRNTAGREASSPVLSSPVGDIHFLFDSSKKASRHRSKKKRASKSSQDHDYASSLELGELSSSGNSSPTKGAGSADMDISSGGGDDKDGNDVSLTEDDKDPWGIIEKDRLGRDAYDRLHGDIAGRYYGSKGGKCQNCKQRGHANKKCPWPKRPTVCYFCASTEHVSSSCPLALCSYCYRKKHRGRPCSVPSKSNTECMRCHMFGHNALLCPDQWRQFHHTLYEHSSIALVWAGQRRTDTDRIYCSNCSKKGHFGFECTDPIPRGNSKHHLPLIAQHDMYVWPPRDGRIAIIQQTLQSRVPSTHGSPITPHPMPHPLEAQDRKRKHAEPSSKAHSSRDEPLPPMKRRKWSHKDRRESRDFDSSDNVVYISSDEPEDSPLLSGHRHSRKNDERYSSRDRPRHSPQRPPSLLGNFRHSLLGDQPSNYSSPPNHSFSGSPFANMNSRSHLPGASQSPLLEDPPFPRTPLLDDPHFPRTPLNYNDFSKGHHQLQRQRKSLDHRPPSRRDYAGTYSAGENPHWRDDEEEPHGRWRPPLPSQPPPETPPLPRHSPSIIPNTTPSRSFSSGFREPQPPAYHRRHSEPAFRHAQPTFKSSTPRSRQDRRNDEYVVSERGFRMSEERAREVSYSRHSRTHNTSLDSKIQRRYSSGYGRH